MGPSNFNLLSPLGFRFSCTKTPTTNYFVQAANLPTVTLGVADQPTQFVNIPRPGDHLKFGTLDLLLKVDEDMKTYIELYSWMEALGFPKSYEQFSSTFGTPREDNSRPVEERQVAQATLTVLSSSKNPIAQIQYRHVFPTVLGSLQFRTTDEGVNYITLPVSFVFQSFEIQPQ